MAAVCKFLDLLSLLSGVGWSLKDYAQLFRAETSKNHGIFRQTKLGTCFYLGLNTQVLYHRMVHVCAL